MAERRTSRRLGAAALGLALAGSLLAGCGGNESDGPPVSDFQAGGDSTYHGTSIDDPWPVEPIALTDTSGEQQVLAETDAPLTLVFFGYSKCPDICQVVMATIASAVARLDDEARDRVEVAFVTTDPARDDPQALRTYLDRLDPDFEGYTGPLEDIVALAKPLHVFLERGRELPDGGYEVDHSTPVLGVMDAGAKIVWTQGVSPAQLAEDIETLLG